MSFLETALDAPILWIGAMPLHLEDATDAGNPETGFPTLALTSNDVKDAPILWIGTEKLYLRKPYTQDLKSNYTLILDVSEELQHI